DRDARPYCVGGSNRSADVRLIENGDTTGGSGDRDRYEPCRRMRKRLPKLLIQRLRRPLLRPLQVRLQTLLRLVPFSLMSSHTLAHTPSVSSPRVTAARVASVADRFHRDQPPSFRQKRLGIER